MCGNTMFRNHIGLTSMVIGNLHFKSIAIFPSKDDAPLIADFRARDSTPLWVAI
jgi:hypothetical protein